MLLGAVEEEVGYKEFDKEEGEVHE